MPHKHRRVRALHGNNPFELPPTSFAQPLPSFTKSKSSAKSTPSRPDYSSDAATKSTKKRKRYKQDNDDTPRAFKRLMSGQRPPRSGLDNGSKDKEFIKNKRKVDTESTPAVTESSVTPASIPSNGALLKPLPGESASAFSARVNAALPISVLQNRRSKKTLPGVKERETHSEKRMKRVRAQWWEEERKIREQREEGEEEIREKLEKFGGVVSMEDFMGPRRQKRKGKRRASDEEGELEEEGDIWAQIGQKAQLTEHIEAAPGKPAVSKQASKRSGGLVGIHDVVSAPPKFSQKLSAKMKAATLKSGNTPLVGGLKHQFELGAARKQVIDRYRAIMKEKRGAATTS